MTSNNQTNEEVFKLSFFEKKLKNPRHHEAFEKFKNNLLDFDELDTVAIESSDVLAEELNKKYKDETVLEFGQEKLITDFYRTIYEEISKNFSLKNPFFKNLMKDFFSRSWVLIEEIHDKRDHPDQWINKALNILIELESYLMFVLMNDEIIEVLYNFHYAKFSRNFFKELWDFICVHNKEFQEFMYHVPVIAVFHHLNFLIKEAINKTKVKTVTRRYSISFKTEDVEYLSPKVEDSSKSYNMIQAELELISDLISNHNAFLTRATVSQKHDYSSEKFYCNLIEKHLGKPEGCQDCFDILSQMPFEKIDTTIEPAVYNELDLALVYLHSFITTMNSYGLAVSSYLYAEELNINPEISGVLQAGVPIGSFMFGFVWNYMTSFKSYKYPFLLSIFFEIIANIMYYFVQNLRKSDGSVSIEGIILLFIARMVLGIGGARLMLRKYIAISVKPWAQTKKSSLLVAVSFAAICIGPGIQAIIFFKPNKCDSFAGSFMCWHNMLAFIWIFLSIALFILFLLFFTGFDKVKYEYKESHKYKTIVIFQNLLDMNLKTAIYEIKMRKIAKKKYHKAKTSTQKIQAEPDYHPGARQFVRITMHHPFLKKDERMEVEELAEEFKREGSFAFNVSRERINGEMQFSPNESGLQILYKDGLNEEIALNNPVSDLHKNQDLLKRKSVLHTKDIIWESKIKYVVFHPVTYTIFAAFFLMLTKVN